MKLGMREEANQDYSKAIELKPQNAEEFNNRGIALTKLGRHEEAVQDYSRAIEFNPYCADYHNNRGSALK